MSLVILAVIPASRSVVTQHNTPGAIQGRYAVPGWGSLTWYLAADSGTRSSLGA
jgi:hypothetical protein